MSQKVIRLAMRHIKGVRQLEILADPVLNEIAGRNGAGKSSVLDAIAWAMGGKKAIVGKALRDGCESGEIVVETEELVVKRAFSEAGETKLVATAKDGRKIGQRELDKLFGVFSFDPLAFSRMDPAEQLTTLQLLAGEEFCVALEALDHQLEEAMAERTLATRELARIGQIPEVPPVEPVDVAELTTELQAIERHNHEQAKLAQEVELLEQRLAGVRGEIKRLEEQMKAAVGRQEGIEEQLKLAARPEPLKDKTALLEQLQQAAAQNRRAQEHEEYKRRLAGKAEAARAHNALEERIGELRRKREDLRASAKLPLPGVEFGERGLRVHGRPWENLSSSEALRTSARIGMLMNPELRVLFIKDGSLLDEDAFAEFRAILTEFGYQGWIESVGQGHGDAVVLEAGEVAQAPLSAVGNF